MNFWPSGLKRYWPTWKRRRTVKTRNKNLDYYLSLNYEIRLRKIDKYEEPLYQAYTRELDPVAFYGVGSTPDEAIRSFEETKREMFEDFLEHGYPIPEPEPIEDESFSGKFLVRTTPRMHRQLLRKAKQQNQSLNSLINEIFTIYLTSEGLVESAKKQIERALQRHLEAGFSYGQVYDLPGRDSDLTSTHKKEAVAA